MSGRRTDRRRVVDNEFQGWAVNERDGAVGVRRKILNQIIHANDEQQRVGGNPFAGTEDRTEDAKKAAGYPGK